MFASIPCNSRNRPPYRALTPVNSQTLRRGFGHRHATGDLEPVRMVGHRRVLIASLNAGVGNLLDRRRTIAPFGVHLQITAVLLNGGAIEGGIREHPPDLRAAQKVSPKLPSSLDIGATLAPFDGLFDGRRCAGLEDLAYHARRTRSDARNSRQGAVGSEQVGQGPVQREDRGGRPLVAEHLLLRRLRERQIAKVPAHNGVHVRICSRLLHRHRQSLVSVRFGQWRLGRPGDHVAGRLEA